MPDSKSIARQIFQQTLASIDIPRVMECKLEFDGKELILSGRTFDLSRISAVRVVAIGKAAHAMAGGLYELLPKHFRCSGIVAAPTEPAVPLAGFRYFASGHPTPDQQSWNAAKAILKLLHECDSGALVFFLLSGGGSALVELPLDPSMKLEDVQTIHRVMVTCGAPIEAINSIRKHLSAVKGGRLAVAAGSALKITLAVTDVPAGRESALASGPTLPDPATIAEVQEIITSYELRKRFPASLLGWLDAGQMPETPKVSDPAFVNGHFCLLLGMHDLFHAAHHAAEAHGYLTHCDNSTDDWPIDKAADSLLAQLEAWERDNPGQRVALVADGEVASPVTGNGIGGRNSAFVLACVEKMAGRKITVLSAGTDGIDGNSPAAGAVADGQSLARASALSLNPSMYFQQSDAYTFFSKLEDTIVTGPTNNNLRDLRVFLSEP
jgi:glycerate 2-kinase